MSLEHIAEDKISAELQLYQFYIAKPKFDIKGTDLIAFVDFKDSLKFGRIQSKGRSLITQKRCTITVSSEYVCDSFFVFVYLNTESRNNNIYYFDVDAICGLWIKKQNSYSYSFTKNNLLNGNYSKYIFDIKKCQSMRRKILENNTETERVLNDIVKQNRKLIKNVALKNELELTLMEYRKAELEIQNSNEQLALLKEIMSLRFKYEMEEVPKELKEEVIRTKDIPINDIIDKYELELLKYIDKVMIKDYLLYLREEA